MSVTPAGRDVKAVEDAAGRSDCYAGAEAFGSGRPCPARMRRECDQPAAAGDDIGEDVVDPRVVRIHLRQLPRPHTLELGVGGIDQLAQAARRAPQVEPVEGIGELDIASTSSHSPGAAATTARRADGARARPCV